MRESSFMTRLRCKSNSLDFLSNLRPFKNGSQPTEHKVSKTQEANLNYKKYLKTKKNIFL